jgi:hypothetical protein
MRGQTFLRLDFVSRCELPMLANEDRSVQEFEDTVFH